MALTSNIIIVISVAAVFVALLLGLFAMLRGGTGNRSQTFMRWRVGLQFLAIVAIVVVLLLRGHSAP